MVLIQIVNYFKIKKPLTPLTTNTDSNSKEVFYALNIWYDPSKNWVYVLYSVVGKHAQRCGGSFYNLLNKRGNNGARVLNQNKDVSDRRFCMESL